MRGGGALRDALAAVSVPFIERHQTYIHTLERFRRHAHFADLAVGTTSGKPGPRPSRSNTRSQARFET